MSKILAQGMITLTQLYEGVQVILSPTAVLIPCDSEENPKSNAYINASTNVKAFLGTMDITSGITLGELEYSDSTVKASKTGTKVSITTITTRTGYVDIPVSATINGETIDLGKHRFNFVKQIDGQPGIPGDPGFGYTLNIKGGVRGVAYAANGTNPEPKTSSQFSVELLKNGVKVANPASISWTCGGNLSGSSSVATFTPTIKSTYNSESSYVRVSVKEFAASLAVEETIPIICTKHADGLDWINEWNNKYVQVGTEKIITPKIFAGTKNSANELTGVAIGRDVLGGNANKVIGIVGYKKNIPVFSLDQDANFFVSSSGSAGDIKNGTNNAKGLYFDGNDLYISGRVRMNGGSTIGANNTSVEEVINNSNLGAQANNKIDNLSIGGRNLIRKGDLAQITSTATYDGATNTWTVNATAGAGGTWGCGLVVNNKNALVPYGKAYVLSFEIKVPRACSWNCDVNNYALTGSSWSGNDNDNVPKRTTSSKSLVANQWIKCWVKWENTNPNNTNKVDIYDNSNFGVVMKDETSNMTYQIRNVKGELGNVPTEWTPAPEDIDSAINNAVTGLKVGGNNLLRNGNFAYNMANWSIHDMNSGGTAKSVETASGGDWVPSGKKALKIKGTNTTDRYGVISSTMKLTPNTKYTISGYCAGHRVNKIQVNVRDRQGNDANIHTININPAYGGNTLDKWYRFETTFTTTANTDFALNLYALNFANDGFVWFTDVQVQEGTKATAWTPCSEDVNSNINDVKNSLSNFQTTVNTTFKDGIIEEAEAKAIAQHLKTLEAEKADIDKEYTAIYSNAYLTGTTKTNLSSAKSSYDSAHASLKSTINTVIADGKVTTSESASVTSIFNTYNTQLGVYKQRVQEALDAISSAKVNNIQVGATNYLRQSGDYLSPYWGNKNATITNEYYMGSKVYKVNAQWGAMTYKKNKELELEPETEYILSAYIKKDSGITYNSGTNMSWYGLSVNTAVVALDNLTTSWKQYSVKRKGKEITVHSDGQGIRIEPNNAITGGYVYVAGIQIEKGNKATDWKPAPEDVNSNINDVKNSLNSFQNTVNTTFKDGIIEQAEAKAIAQHLKTLDAEKADVDKEYSTIYGNSLLGGTAKTNLANAKTSFDSAHSSLKSTINTAISDGKVTSTEKANVDSAFTTYNGVLGTYKQRVQEALNAISSAKVDNIQIGGRNLVSDSNLGGLTSNAYGFGGRKVIGGLKNNTTYTFTVNGRSNPNGNTEGKHLRCYVYETSWNHGSWNFGISETSDTTRSLTFTTGNTIEGKDVIVGFYWYPNGGNRTGNATVNWCKVEQGNKATDWTPAPEDIDNNITDVKNSLSGFQNTVNTTFKDGIIEQAEAKAIARHIQILDTEKVDVDKEYSIVYNNSALSGTAKTNLASAKTEFDNAHTSLKSTINTAIADGKITSSEKTSVDNTFSTYNSILGTYRQRVQEALDAISSAKVNNIQIGGRNLATSTNQGTTGWNWGLQTGGKTISEVTENGIRCCKMVRDNVASTGWSYISYSRIGRDKYLPNKQYTVSFEVKSSVATDFWCSLKEGNSSNPLNVSDAKATVSKANTWTKLSFTLTTKDTLPTSTGQVVYLTMNSGTGVSYIFRNLMIEEGTKASSWTPAPEDIDNNITDVKNSLNSVQTTVNNNKNNWSNAYNRVAEWAQGAVTGNTDINGGKIATNTITAEKIAVGDFNNYATVSELNPATMLPSSHFGGTKIVSPNSTTTEIAKTNSSNAYLMLSGFIPTPFVVNDELLISFRAYNCLSENKAVTFSVWYYDANKTHITSNNVAITLTSKTWKDYEASLKLTSINTNVRYVVIGFNDSNGTDLRIRNPRVVRKSMGKMIVDGTIEARHIKSDVLSASTIVSTINNGTTTISGEKITSGTLSANKITTGTLDANKVNVTNLNASNIKSGTLDASKISVTNLNASNITSGTLRGGGCNLLKNSDAKNGTSFWQNNGGGLSIGTAGANPFIGDKEFRTSFPSGMKYSEEIRLKSNTDYVYEAWIHATASSTGTSLTPLHFWCSATSGGTDKNQCEVKDYRQNLINGTYTKVYVHFRTKSGNVFFRPFIYSTETISSICVKQISLSEGTIESSWSPHPNEIYDGITTIDKDGITVTSSNVKSKTNMSANGFKITKTDTNEDVFKVNSDGTLTLKGNMTITGGSVSDNALSSTIRNGASAGSSAKSTLDSKASGWDSAKSTVDSNSSNWGNAYNRVKEWASGAVTGSTTINGGKIATNTITVNKLAVGDFTNISQIDENLAPNGNTVITHSDNYKYFRFGNDSSASYHALIFATLNGGTFKVGDRFKFTFTGFGNKSISTTFIIRARYTDNTWNNLGSASYTFDTANKTRTVELQITSGLTAGKTLQRVLIFNEFNNTTGLAYMRNICINRMTTGELIVDGSIKTSMIHSDGLNASVIKAGTISADRLDANTIVSKVNGGTTEINGNRIQTGTLSASKITTGTLDATKVSVTNLNANNIKSGTIDASKISVTNLNASNITSGTLRGGGYNLLRNSGFKNEKNYWHEQKHNNPTGGIFELISSSATWGYPDASVKAAQIRLSNQSSIEYGIAQSFNTTIGKQYTLSFQYAGHRVSGANAIIRNPNSKWLANKSFTPTDYNGGNGSVNNWGTYSLTFTATATSHTLNIVINTAQDNGYLWIAKPQIVEGAMTLPYSPHPSEIYAGIVKLDENGVQVSHTGAKTTTHMNSQGFFIYNSQGETVGSLATETGLSIVNANKVYADNIPLIYEGDSNLYVNHNHTGSNQGTSQNPFRSFADLKRHLESQPIINKNLNIYIKSTGGDITEQLFLTGLTGSGRIWIYYDKACVHRQPAAGQYSIVLDNITNYIGIEGNRSNSNSNDGAIICDGWNAHGISIANCSNVFVGNINIHCQNWGIKVARSKIKTRRVDFCGTWCCLELSELSHGVDSDSCGGSSSGDFFRLYDGSIFLYGDSSQGGYRPVGRKNETTGRYLLIGAERTATASFRTPPPKPTTSDQYGTWSMRDYGYFTYGRNGVNVNSWNPASKRIQQGEWSGYGNNYGFAFFDDAGIRSWLSNGTPKDGSTITLKRASAGGYSSSQPIYLCGATNTSCSGTPSGVKSYGNIGSLAWGETKTFNLPTSFVNDLKSGAIKSVCFYDSSGASYVKIDSVSIKLKANKPV